MAEAAAGREMTPEELFDMAISNRREMLETARLDAAKVVPFAEDVPMLSLMADERAHRRADAKLDRLIGHGEVRGDLKPASSRRGYGNVPR